MIARRYQLYMTEATHAFMDELVKNGHEIRAVLNSGIILYVKASHEQRGIAHMEAYSKPKKDLHSALDVISSTNIELLSAEDAALVSRLRQVLGPPDPHQNDREAAIADHNAAAAAEEAHRDKHPKRAHRGSA